MANNLRRPNTRKRQLVYTATRSATVRKRARNNIMNSTRLERCDLRPALRRRRTRPGPLRDLWKRPFISCSTTRLGTRSALRLREPCGTSHALLLAARSPPLRAFLEDSCSSAMDRHCRTAHPFRWATRFNASSGLTATGCPTARSMGMSLRLSP
jgi:hypothetical protein